MVCSPPGAPGFAPDFIWASLATYSLGLFFRIPEPLFEFFLERPTDDDDLGGASWFSGMDAADAKSSFILAAGSGFFFFFKLVLILFFSGDSYATSKSANDVYTTLPLLLDLLLGPWLLAREFLDIPLFIWGKDGSFPTELLWDGIFGFLLIILKFMIIWHISCLK